MKNNKKDRYDLVVDLKEGMYNPSNILINNIRFTLYKRDNPIAPDVIADTKQGEIIITHIGNISNLTSKEAKKIVYELIDEFNKKFKIGFNYSNHHYIRTWLKNHLSSVRLEAKLSPKLIKDLMRLV